MTMMHKFNIPVKRHSCRLKTVQTKTLSTKLISLQSPLRLLSSGSLVVIAPTVDDTAVYECVVSNEAGQESRAIQLTVHGECPADIYDILFLRICELMFVFLHSSSLDCWWGHRACCKQTVSGGHRLYCVWCSSSNFILEQRRIKTSWKWRGIHDTAIRSSRDHHRTAQSLRPLHLCGQKCCRHRPPTRSAHSTRCVTTHEEKCT